MEFIHSICAEKTVILFQFCIDYSPCIVQDPGSRLCGEILFVFSSEHCYHCTVWKLVRADTSSQDIEKTCVSWAGRHILRC